MNTVCKNRENSKTKKQGMHPAFRGIIAEHFNLSHLSSFRVGGDASLFIEPFSQKALFYAFDFLKSMQGPFFILGGASNLVIADEGIPIPVLSMRSLRTISLDSALSSTEEKNNQAEAKTLFLRCEAGASISEIIDFCIAEGLTGLEQFAGLPGSIGGAVFMNARCYELSISERLSLVRFIDCEKIGKAEFCNAQSLFEDYFMNEADWDYKVSPFQNTKNCIVEVVLRVEKADTQKVADNAAVYVADREKKGHFKYPSAGSVFKNNRNFGKPSGKIVDEAGLRGLQRGGAQVAPWHGNFIINTGSATAKDIRYLVEEVQKSVKKQFGFDLEPEIIFSDSLIKESSYCV
ncbi:MAG: UDP-N-acetylmuramate dehydrogenase [Spirochaetota bacterium]|jgi:UDP-N-acetylmuramate dehydrogenase|nr:UDP-N-acetylmuramate dehydrogenase [Spirochaetota bacterium]